MRRDARFRSWGPAFAILIVLLAAPESARASDPAIERLIKRQDELAGAERSVELLNEAKAAVSREDTAVNRYLLGRAYGLAEEFEKAREQFDWALEKDATCPYPYHGLGVFFMLQGKFEEAEKLFRTALKIDARLTRAHTDLGKLLLMKGDNPGAERSFRTVLGYEPDNFNVRALLAQHYLRRKKYELAVQEFQWLLAVRPGERGARKGLALALVFDKRPDDAIREFERVIEEQPKDFESYLFLERLLLEKGKKAVAIEVLEKLIANAPPDSREAVEARREIDRVKKGPEKSPRAFTLDEVVEKLDSEDVTERREAMRMLLALGVVPPPARVLRSVQDRDKAVRVMAVKNVGRTAGALALGLLEVLLLSPRDRDPEEEVRGAAVAALADLRTAAAIPVYLAALDDESLYVFRLAVKGLRTATGRLFVGTGEEPLTREQRGKATERWRGWWRSARAFAAKLDCIEEVLRLGNPRLGIYLAELMEDPDPVVVRKARDAFFRLTSYRVGTDADMGSAAGRSKLRRQALEALERMRKGPR